MKVPLVQVGRLYGGIRFPRFWRSCGVFHFGWEHR